MIPSLDPAPRHSMLPSPKHYEYRDQSANLKLHAPLWESQHNQSLS